MMWKEQQSTVIISRCKCPDLSSSSKCEVSAGQKGVSRWHGWDLEHNHEGGEFGMPLTTPDSPRLLPWKGNSKASQQEDGL